jgi:hypothetical protein
MEVTYSMTDDGAFGWFNKSWEDTDGEDCYRYYYENIDVRTLRPSSNWSIDSFLDIRSVEVDASSIRHVTERTRETKNILEFGACCGNFVHIKAKVDIEDIVEWKYASLVINEGNGCNVCLDKIVRCRRVAYHSDLHIVVLSYFSTQFLPNF